MNIIELNNHILKEIKRVLKENDITIRNPSTLSDDDFLKSKINDCKLTKKWESKLDSHKIKDENFLMIYPSIWSIEEFANNMREEFSLLFNRKSNKSLFIRLYYDENGDDKL